jgi:outer membrane protein
MMHRKGGNIDMCRKIVCLVVALAAALCITVDAARAEQAGAPEAAPLTLEDCINIALGGHPKVKGAEQDLEAGRYQTRQAISGFWPNISFDASRNYTHYEREIRIGSQTVTTTANYVVNNFTFNTNWTFFDSGRTYYKVKGLAELEGSLLSTLTATEQAVAYDVMDAYFGLLSAQSMVDVANQTKSAADTHLKQAQSFFDVGVKPRFDVTQAEVEVNNAKLQVIQAQDAVKTARATLNTKLGYPPLADTKVVDMPVTEALETDVNGYIARALENRPELKSQEFQIRSAQAGVKGAYADFLPTFSAGAVQNWYKEDHSNVLSNENAQITVDVPLFEGFRSWAALGEARARALSAGYQLDDMKRDITLEVTSAYLSAEDAKARIDSLESSVKKAQENLDIAQGRYEAGVGAFIEVTDAQVGLTSAKTDLTKAKYDYHTAYANLLKSVGAPVKGGGKKK